MSTKWAVLAARRRFSAAAPSRLGQKPLVEEEFDGEFRRLTVRPPDAVNTFRSFRRPTRAQVAEPRAASMKPDQDWPSVWPAPASFRASAVPLPVRMGYQKRPDRNPPPCAAANLELVKVPNFLHLTPKAVTRQCEALKPFCTEFPPALKDEAALDALFPVAVVTQDWVHSGASLREPKARAVTLRLKLAALGLSADARDKLLRLVQGRYDHATDLLSLGVDRCPRRHQNRAYADYLLTVLFFEAGTPEPWELEKAAADAARFEWEGSESQAALKRTLGAIAANSRRQAAALHDEEAAVGMGHNSKSDFILRLSKADDVDAAIDAAPEIQDYVQKWERLRNEPDTDEALEAYAASVRSLLGLSSLPPPGLSRPSPASRAARHLPIVDAHTEPGPVVHGEEVNEHALEEEAPRRRGRLRPITKTTDVSKII